MFKSGFVAVIGRPNVGKSTLTNTILGQKLSITSKKPQTTRNKISLIYTTDDAQIIFLDTPGIQKPKNKLGRYMLDESTSSLEGIDIVTMMVEPELDIGPTDRKLLERLAAIKNTPKILLINKVDLIQKELLLPIIEKYSKLNIFEEIIPISAEHGDNVEHYISVLLGYLEEGPKYYPEDMVTDQPMKFIVAEMIREKGLYYLNQEVPHGLAVKIEKMQARKNKDICDIAATIYVERESHKGIIIGKAGSMMKKINTAARREIEGLLGMQVNLQVWVKVSKNWRDKDEKVRHFGYE